MAAIIQGPSLSHALVLGLLVEQARVPKVLSALLGTVALVVCHQKSVRPLLLQSVCHARG